MSETSTTPIIPVPQLFVKQYGLQLIAMEINATLYGIGLLMVIQYFARHGRTDPWFVKGTVGLLCLLASLETIFIDHQSYMNYVLTFGQYEMLNDIVWTVPAKFLAVFLTSFVAQMFFAWCIWIMSRNLGMRYRLLVIPITFFAAMQISSGIVQASMLITARVFSALAPKKFWNMRVTAMQGSATAACDISITISLILLSRASSSRTQRGNEDSLTSKLVVYALNRAVVTGICAIIYIVFVYNTLNTYFFMIPFLASTHFNVMSVTSLLMSRDTLRQEIDQTFRSESTRHMVALVSESPIG